MNFEPNWPRPVRRKLRGLNLPLEVELAFVQSVSERVSALASESPGQGRGICFDGAIGMHSFYGWAAYTWDGGTCVITDLGCELVAECEP